MIIYNYAPFQNGKYLLPEGEILWVLLFLLCTCVNCVIGATPMLSHCTTCVIFGIKHWVDTKQRTTKHRTITEPHNGSSNQQRINNNKTNALERTAAKATGGGGLDAFYWYQIFALDSAVVETQKVLSTHVGFLPIAMYHHRETIDIFQLHLTLRFVCQRRLTLDFI